MTAATPTLRRIFLEDALVSTASLALDEMAGRCLCGLCARAAA